MMVETILESSQDFGMSNGTLPQWKRELLQRRAARVRPAPAPTPAPPPPPPLPPPVDEDDEELRYGPGIVKRLKSRYLSLALRDAPRRRPSVLRRAASLEHLLDERPPPAPRPARAPRPASVAAPPPHPRRDLVKRARSVDALSRLEEAPSPPPSRPSLAPAPAPTPGRAPRPPRRPAPLLRDAERPPPDVVRSTLRKFESAPTRRAAPAARVSAVLRGLEAPHRSVTPEREPSPPSPPPLPPTPPPPASPAPPPPASPAPPSPALAFSTRKVERPPSPTIEPSPAPSSPSPASKVPSPGPALAPRPVSPVAPSPPRAAPAPAPSPFPAHVAGADAGDARLDPTPKEDEFGSTFGSDEVGATQATRRVSRAALEGIARAGSSVRYAFEAARGGGGGGSHLPPLALALGAANPVLVARRVGVIRPMPAAPRSPPASAPAPITNGHRSPPPPTAERPAWARAAPRSRAPPPQATSVVFNFSGRKEVPDYIENDGIVLRGSRRPKYKAGETGVVCVRGGGAPGAAGGGDSDSEGEGCEADGGGGEPLRVRFVNDNVLINGRSSMPARPDRQRQAKLKLQFDDSLTRTHEYPSETSLVFDDSPLAPAPGAPAPAPGAPAPAPDAAPAPTLVDNTHIASAALSRYAPSKTRAAATPLGLAPQHAHTPQHSLSEANVDSTEAEAEAEAGEQWEAAPWSAARALATDLLF